MSEPILAWPKVGHRSVPYRVYHDAEVYAREQEKIFRGPVWHFVALEAELPDPGDFKTTYIGDTPVVITRDADGSLHGFVNRCAHRGSTLCLEFSGKKRAGFTCVYHAWSYDLRGNLTNAAFRRGIRGQGGLPADFELEDHGLQKLRVDSFAGLVFATMSDKTEPLEHYIGDTVAPGIRRTMNRPIRILGYDSQVMQSNWKTYAENTRDSFHANILHTFFGTFGISRQTQDSAIIVDPRGTHLYTYTKRGTEVASAEYDATAADLRSVKANFSLQDASLLDWKDEFGDGSSTFLVSLFPVFMIQQVSHSLAVRQLIPRSPTRCELIFTYFGFADDPPEMTQHRLKHVNLTGSAGLVSMEDGAVAEFVGNGTKGAGEAASYIEMGGREIVDNSTSKLSEKPLRGFWNAYKTLMEF